MKKSVIYQYFRANYFFFELEKILFSREEKYRSIKDINRRYNSPGRTLIRYDFAIKRHEKICEKFGVSRGVQEQELQFCY